MANISFPRQFLYIAAAIIGAKLGWEFASDYNLLVKIISALIGFYIVMTIVAFIMIKVFKKEL
jgi:hypothetical protein